MTKLNKDYSSKMQKWLRVYLPEKYDIIEPSKGFRLWFITVAWGESMNFPFKLPYFMIVWNNY